MATEHQELRVLLANDLPLDEVGPHLRRTVRRALQADDRERMLLAGRAVVAELLRRGDLLKVLIEEPNAPVQGAKSLYLLQKSRRLVDIKTLGYAEIEIPWERKPASGQPGSAPAVEAAPQASHAEFGSVAGMLGAMEEAQDLEIGDLHSGERAVVLAGIIRLLGKFTPQFRLFIVLDESEPLGEVTSGVYPLPADTGPEHWLSVRTAGQSVWIPTETELPLPIRAELAAAEGPEFPVRAAVAVPLWSPRSEVNGQRESEEAGLLFVAARDAWPRESLLRLADRLTRFVTRRWQHQTEVNQRIHSDGLTGVFNRAYFDKQFTLELERARRSNVPLTLIMADLDHFKQINDDYGHPAGDEVLKMVARRVQEELRRIDHVCRIGGEEFAFILPDTGEEAAREVMARLLDASFSEEIHSEGSHTSLAVTFSYGGVTFPTAGADAFELYRKADAMLYLSKDAGRNQCHFWNSAGDHTQLLPGGGSTE